MKFKRWLAAPAAALLVAGGAMAAAAAPAMAVWDYTKHMGKLVGAPTAAASVVPAK